MQKKNNRNKKTLHPKKLPTRDIPLPVGSFLGWQSDPKLDLGWHSEADYLQRWISQDTQDISRHPAENDYQQNAIILVV